MCTANQNPQSGTPPVDSNLSNLGSQNLFSDKNIDPSLAQFFNETSKTSVSTKLEEQLNRIRNEALLQQKTQSNNNPLLNEIFSPTLNNPRQSNFIRLAAARG